MGVDDELLKRLGKSKMPAFQDDELFQPAFRRNSPSLPRSAVGAGGNMAMKELKTELKRLTTAVDELLAVFSKAHEDIKAEPNEDFSKKLDQLVEQNEEIGRALLLLLELHREHLPQIARNTRVSSQLKLRRPAAQIFKK